MDAYAALTFTHNKPPHPGQTWERRVGGHLNQYPPGHSSSELRPTPPGKQFTDASNPRGGCKLCGS